VSDAPEEPYLWDRTGEPDPEVAALERLLGPAGHDAERRGDQPAVEARSDAARSSSARSAWRRLAGLPRREAPGAVRRLLVVSLATLLALGLTALLLVRTLAPPPVAPPAPVAPGAGLVVVASGAPLPDGSWFEATEESRVLDLPDTLGRLTLDAGSRLRVDRGGADAAHLYLERGRLDAYVSGKARPRFFQVETPATTCVDLGCAYTLTVGDDGAARVVVRSGRVVFESHGRTTFMPAGATCTASRELGPGTPRFTDAPPALVAAADAFDAARAAPPAERRALADALLRAVGDDPRHSLTAWHLLQEQDPEVVAAARAALALLLGSFPPALGPLADGAEREAWRLRCVQYWPGAW
jgi:hypothetical protein